MRIGLSPLQAGDDFEATIAECERAEAAGFDSIWLGEHHNNPVLQPAPLLRLAAIASRTRRLRLGTSVLLLPLYHPLAVAEDAAMVDVISRGRLILGLGAGYAPEEFEAFGVPITERGSRMDEAVPLIQRLWSEDKVTHRGRHYQVTGATVAPRPVQRPRPPMWFAGWVEPAIRRAAHFGDAWLGGPSATLAELSACVQIYRGALRFADGSESTASLGATPGNRGGEPDTADQPRARGADVTADRDSSAGVALMRYVFVADTVERARAIAGDAFIRSFENLYFRWPHPVVKRPAGDLTIDRLADDRIVLGDPASCVRQIERFETSLGLTHFIVRLSVPGIPRKSALASLDLFTRHVMPALR